MPHFSYCSAALVKDDNTPSELISHHCAQWFGGGERNMHQRRVRFSSVRLRTCLVNVAGWRYLVDAQFPVGIRHKHYS